MASFSSGFYIPWSCLQDQDQGQPLLSQSSSNVWSQKCTFSQVLNNVL